MSYVSLCTSHNADVLAAIRTLQRPHGEEDILSKTSIPCDLEAYWTLSARCIPMRYRSIHPGLRGIGCVAGDLYQSVLKLTAITKYSKGWYSGYVSVRL